MRLSHVTWNIAGLSLPLLVAAVTIPHLIDRLGVERFGLLTLAWGLIGYAGALDFGIGRALTQMVSRLQGENKPSDIPDALATAGRITMITGLVGAGVIAICAILGAASLLNAKAVPTTEITTAILLLAIAVPAQSISATYRGLNEAFLNFESINLLRAGLGVVNFGGPFVVSNYTTELPWLVSALMVARLVALGLYIRLARNCLKKQNIHKANASFSNFIAENLIKSGGWVTVSGVLNPIMSQTDRFIISSYISAGAVLIYVVPYEIVSQSLIISGAVTSVLFPFLSKAIHANQGNWKELYRKYLLLLTGIMLGVSAAIALFLPEILKLWLNKNFDSQMVAVGRIICIGVVANSIGSMYYALVQSWGRIDLTGKFHLIELPIYICMLALLIHKYGVIGSAMAWTGRVTLDAALLVMAAKHIEKLKSQNYKNHVV